MQLTSRLEIYVRVASSLLLFTSSSNFTHRAYLTNSYLYNVLQTFYNQHLDISSALESKLHFYLIVLCTRIPLEIYRYSEWCEISNYLIGIGTGKFFIIYNSPWRIFLAQLSTSYHTANENQDIKIRSSGWIGLGFKKSIKTILDDNSVTFFFCEEGGLCPMVLMMWSLRPHPWRNEAKTFSIYVSFIQFFFHVPKYLYEKISRNTIQFQDKKQDDPKSEKRWPNKWTIIALWK